MQLIENGEKLGSNLHFILCKERTGSSLLTAMLNSSDEVLAVAEETFSLYLYPRYGKVKNWSDSVLESFFDDFVLMSKKNLDLYFTNIDLARIQFLEINERELSYHEICLRLYSLFFPSKKKDKVKVFVDKQIDYLFHLDKVEEAFPKSKFVVLVRDPRDNVEACIRRDLGNKNIRYQASLWHLFYKSVLKKDENENFLFIRYEDLILEAEKTLKLICKHISVEFSKSMLNYTSGVKELLAFQEKQVDEGFKEEFASFHEGLTKSLDASKIGSYKAFFTVEEIAIINNILANDANLLGYDIEAKSSGKSLVDYWWLIRAIIEKKWLLNLYYYLPVSVKLLIKKVRRKKVDV